jgi:hypothetical protein
MPLTGSDRSAAKRSPMEIVNDPLRSTQEKIELLNRLKAEVTGHDANPDGLEYEPEEIDQAIEELELKNQRDVRPQPTIFGGGL